MSNDKVEAVQDVLDLKNVEAQMLATHETLEKWMQKSAGEIEVAQSVSNETKSAVDKLAEKAEALGDKIAELEQKQADRFDDKPQVKTVGEALVESDEFKSWLNRKNGKERIEFKTLIGNDYTAGMAQPLVEGDRLSVVWHEPNRVLRIRDVLPAGRTSSDIVWFTKENAFTNNAGHQVAGSPLVQTDGTALSESAITFTSDSEYVKTIGHFIPVSLQALSDSAFLASYVNNRLMYGLKLKEETEFLNGTGGQGSITGINQGATAYAQADSPNVYDQDIEYIRDMKRQAEQSNYMPDVVVLNPKNWSDIELRRETSNGQFILANPHGMIESRLWGMRVVVSNSQTAGTVTVFDSNTYQIFDREDAAVEVSYEDSTNFQKLQATIRCYERVAFVCYSTSGTIKTTGI